MSATTPAGTAAAATANAVTARGLELRARGRTVFSGVDVEAPVGSTVVVRGAASTGKTSLLLTLAGRMKPTGGRLRVLGEELPARAGAVRREVALAEVRGVNELDDALTVEQHVAERLVLHQPWYRPWVSADQVDEQVERAQRALDVTAGTGADVPALRPREFVSDLAPLERMALGVVLALIGRPRVLVVDDVDALRSGEDRRRAWEALAALQRTSSRPLTVLASCTDTTDIRWHAGDDRILLDLQGTP
ncbi:ABC-type multidrug transport system ATPase subunit [Kineococcus radiotolerans]|uniref:ABC-type multidrug transport system ATPase subunit n=1 Tax=Kineococcus radiotolerans TaxID=131568 RepID=A0A7W4TLF3_KINRA|nr:ATP-binding cassette domain-containing protein [Kineococcus radiotolerans]MBB2900970.1 ABC-type multidrug transport system ATPase subunit [Kineococcus radiotolerans]